MIVILLAAPVVAQTTAHFIGPDGGLWSDSTNWDLAPGLVPADGGGDTYNVIIPAGMTVVFDLPTPTQITGMSMETGSGLDLTDTSLEIIGVALLENIHINVDGADAEFLTNSPFVSGESQRLNAINGATVRLALPKYVLSNSYISEYDLGGPFLSSSDNNSTLNLSSLTEIDATQAVRSSYTVLASNGGDINLSNVSTLKGAGGNARLKFRAESGGSSIDLSGLRQITEGNTWFQLAGGSIDLSSLESVVNTRFDVPSGETLDLGIGASGNGFTTATGSEFLLENGATINAPLLTDFSNSSITLTPTTILNAPLFTQIDNAQIHVKEGRSFAVADTEYILSNSYISEYDLGGPFLSSSDNNSTLNLSSLTEIDATQAVRSSYTVLASNGGDINLSNVSTLKGAGGGAQLKFRAESNDSSIDLSDLRISSAAIRGLSLLAGPSIYPLWKHLSICGLTCQFSKP